MRYLCIHGHFYQPPRENPWLEAIELQDSAYPYHDWNERIAGESYAPNAAARILDSEGRIVKIVNNYSRINFNFGPSLLAWAKEKAPDLHEMIVDADRQSITQFSGHGSAIAQAYNHMIMPLANRADKITQVKWGLEDFRYRFGRDPKGMWLPETAVDLETLDIMAGFGLDFTILAQHQAHLVRRIGRSEWMDVTGGRIDPTRAYRCNLPSGKSMSIFFYDGPISRAVAFEGLLNNGEFFAQRLLSGYSSARDWPELAHIATDGESYGHHHRYGEMALAYAIDHVEQTEPVRITNYSEFLALHPPTHEVEIYENTAWSCAHGVGRWRENCSCNSGGHGDWNQEWRGPLREALDWLRDEVAGPYERRMRELVHDPAAARNGYINVVLDRAVPQREKFINEHARRELRPAEQVELWKLLELQRHAMLMYTSCGWFFDELSGIETVQVIQYAGRVVQLAQELFNGHHKADVVYASRNMNMPARFDDMSLESRFIEKLSHAKSNVTEYGDGAEIYRRSVQPAFLDLRKVGAHYAISSVFETYPEEARVYSYTVRRHDLRVTTSGRFKMVIGRATFTSEITLETGLLTFGVIHFGDHNLHGGVRAFRGEAEYNKLLDEANQAFSRADIPDVIRAFDRGFGLDTYSLKSLFRDEQRRILNQILTSTLSDAEAVYRQLYEHHAPLMRFLADLKAPLPKAFLTTAEYALNSHLRHALSADTLDLDRIKKLLEEAELVGVELDATTLEFTVRKTIERLAQNVNANRKDLSLVKALRNAARVLGLLPFPVTLWAVQNVSYSLLQDNYPEFLELAASGDEQASGWIDDFRAIARKLSLNISPPN
jgi:alpha-amylase/alpha-mannosidase (GH57 family)